MEEEINLLLDPDSQLVTVNDPSPTISVRWDRAVQQAVIDSSPGPTVASRAYGILHTAMFDAWAAYDPDAIASSQLGDDLQRPTRENTEANKIEAMSFAAYRVLTELFPTEQATFDQLMQELGFDPSNTTTDTTTAAGIGNVSAETLMQFRRTDGSNQQNGYVNNINYQPVNSDSDNISDIEKWTPEFVPIDSDPGDSDFLRQQGFLTPQWSVVTPFGLESSSAARPVAPEPFLLVDGATVDLDAGTITLADGSVVEISPAIVGTDPNAGAIINEAFVSQAQRVVDISANLTDEQKLIAEFWEDGGGTSFPPGTWMTFGQLVSARDSNTLDEDAELFLALGNAVFDAGVATWEAKVFYDYARPVRVIRELGKLGLLNNGAIGTDAITGETGFVINAWAGPGLGTQTILADNFLTYQTPGGDPSPPFAEYTSGHSAFSASGARILQLFTGSDDFGASVTFAPGESRFEPGVTPTGPLTLEWDTFSEAADEGGISRLYGGIHFDDGDQNGRALGRQVGDAVWQQAQQFVNPSTDISGIQIDAGSNGTFSFSSPSSSVTTLNLQSVLNSTDTEENQTNEVGLVRLNSDSSITDANGNILNSGDAGFLQAVLEQGEVLFTGLSEEQLLSGAATRTLRLSTNQRFGFYLVAGNSADRVLDTSDFSNVTFSSFQTVANSDGSFTLNFEDNLEGDTDFADLGLTFQTQAGSTTLDQAIAHLQNTDEGELLDFRGLEGTFTATTTTNREGAWNNFIGFYEVENENGGIDTNGDGVVDLDPGNEGYLAAVVQNRLADIALSAANSEFQTFTNQFAGGSLYAPFIIVDGSPDTANFSSSNTGNANQVYTPFAIGNADGADHFRSLGDNAFGVEDMFGLGDADYDDVVWSMGFA